MKMMNNNSNITCFSDLEREEMRVKKRVKKQEDAIKIKLQTLPEEIISIGISKAISGILSGNIFKSAVSVIKTVGSALIDNKKDESNSSGGMIDIIKNFIKSKLSA
jgi:hypothetical protein